MSLNIRGGGPSVGTQKTVEFSVEQLKLPTMTLVKKALEQQDPALSYENVTKFSSSLPKENGKTQLDTFKLNGEDCFQGAMTFSIEAKRKDGSSVTLSFTQMIQTTIKVPYNGDNIQTEAAMKTALFKLEGYRQHIGEPLRASLDTRVDLAAIKALEKTSFTITTNQENIQRRVTERTSDPSVTRAFEAITLTVEGKELQAETLWTQKIECPSINNRNKALDEFCQLTAKGEPIPKKLLSKYGLDTNTAINIVARNTQQDMESWWS